MINDIGNFGTEPKIVVDDIGKSYMLETARWGKFLGVVFATLFALVCLMFPLLMRMNPAYSSLPAGAASIAGIIYVVLMVAINVYPLYALISFSNKMKAALNDNDQAKFNLALRLQKSLYKYIGIFTIILLFFYGIIILFSLTIAVTSSI